MKKIKELGYTLTELMIVLGILTILLAMAIPDIKSWLPMHRLKAAARQIASDMQLARYRAIATNIRHGLYFTGDGLTYIVYSDQNDNRNFDGGEEGKSVTLEHIMYIDHEKTINFLPGGTATPGRVTIKNRKEQTISVIVLGTTGRIRIE